MRRSARHRSSRTQFLLGIAAAAALAIIPQGALAQHGGHGGGGGGGHFGGGGGHFGGSSGGSHASAPAPSSHAASSHPNSAPVHPPLEGFGTSSSLPVALGFGQSASDPHAGAIVDVPQESAAPKVTIGFPPDRNAFSFASPKSSSASPQSFEAAHPGVLSFSGQGHEIWQDAPRSAAPVARPLTAPVPQRLRVFNPRNLPRIFPGSGAGFAFYQPAYFYNPFFFGFGFNTICNPWDWGWNFGWNWDYGCNNFGYFGYPGYYGSYYDSSSLYSDYGDTGSTDANSYTPQITPESTAPESNAGQTSAVLYLNDGTSFSVTDYWVADYKLHYISDGRENVLDLDQIDVQRTVDMNAANGVTFTLKPAPGPPAGGAAAPPPPPSSTSAPPRP